MLSYREIEQLLNVDLSDVPVKRGKRYDHLEVRDLLIKSRKFRTPQIITMAALKGGIGKTFLSTHVAVRLSQLGHRVLILDLDPEACASNSLLTDEQVENKNKRTILEIIKGTAQLKESIIPTKYRGLDLLPASLKISKAERVVSGKNPKTLVKKLVSDLPYEFIFLELAPSFSTLSSSSYLASDMVIIPCIPNIHSLESVDLTIEAVNEVAEEFEVDHISFRVLMNMFNPKRNASQDVLNFLINDYPHLLLPCRIKESAEYQNAINEGITIFETTGNQRLKKEFDKLINILFPLKDIKGKEFTYNLQTLQESIMQ